jgi:hypothetical protein
MVTAGVGGSIEWSDRFIRAKAVMGMWQEMHLLPSLSARWCVCSVGLFTLASWQGTQALLNFSFLNRYRPLDVWQWMQSIFPDFAQGLMVHDVSV